MGLKDYQYPGFMHLLCITVSHSETWESQFYRYVQPREVISTSLIFINVLKQLSYLNHNSHNVCKLSITSISMEQLQAQELLLHLFYFFFSYPCLFYFQSALVLYLTKFESPNSKYMGIILQSQSRFTMVIFLDN